MRTVAGSQQSPVLVPLARAFQPLTPPTVKGAQCDASAPDAHLLEGAPEGSFDWVGRRKHPTVLTKHRSGSFCPKPLNRPAGVREGSMWTQRRGNSEEPAKIRGASKRGGLDVSSHGRSARPTATRTARPPKAGCAEPGRPYAASGSTSKGTTPERGLTVPALAQVLVVALPEVRHHVGRDAVGVDAGRGGLGKRHGHRPQPPVDRRDRRVHSVVDRLRCPWRRVEHPVVGRREEEPTKRSMRRAMPGLM